MATNHCAQEILEAIIKALAPACPERAMAGWGRRFRIAIQGKDPRAAVPGGKPFIWHFFQARPGGGASPAGDGWPGAGEWQAAGGIKFGSLEVTEVRFPLFFRRHEFRPDSGGAGQYRGGPGGVVEMVVETAEPAVGNTAGDGVRHGACGILGGADGVPHRYMLYSKGQPPRAIKTKEVGLEIRPGDVLVLESGGGGGWGDPARAPRRTARDIENGFVTDAPLTLQRGTGLPLRARRAAPRPAMRGEGWREGHRIVPHRHRCRRHLYRPRRGRRLGADDPGQGPLDPGRSLARRPRRACNCWPTRCGLDRSALFAETERIVHGTTVATNALLERKGAKVGLLTTEGHRDVIEMREGLKDDRYNLRLPPPEQLVPRHLRLGVRERMRADGSIETPLDRLARPRDRGSGARAGRGGGGVLSACLARPRPRARHARAPSSARCPAPMSRCPRDVLPQIKEFERVSTTIVNAYVGPVLSRYLARLEAAPRRGRLSAGRP